jgi:hypothetical protein
MSCEQKKIQLTRILPVMHTSCLTIAFNYFIFKFSLPQRHQISYQQTNFYQGARFVFTEKLP